MATRDAATGRKIFLSTRTSPALTAATRRVSRLAQARMEQPRQMLSEVKGFATLQLGVSLCHLFLRLGGARLKKLWHLFALGG